jgi:hypothetical protein
MTEKVSKLVAALIRDGVRQPMPGRILPGRESSSLNRKRRFGVNARTSTQGDACPNSAGQSAGCVGPIHAQTGLGDAPIKRTCILPPIERPQEPPDGH